MTSHVEIYEDGKWVKLEEEIFPIRHRVYALPGQTYTSQPFLWHERGLYAFLVGARNYFHIPIFAEPKGLPEGGILVTNYDDCLDYTQSWFMLDDLLAFNYQETFENREGDARDSVGAGAGTITTYAEFLSNEYFDDLAILSEHLKGQNHRARIVVRVG